MIRHFTCKYQLHISRFLSTIIPSEQIQSSNEEDCVDTPDFRTLPADTSCIPLNSPYYLYNIDPTWMSRKYMKGVIKFHRKKFLRKLRLNSSELERACTGESKESKELVCKEGEPARRARPYKFNLYHPNALPHRIAVDLSYSHLMTSIEMSSTVKQLLHLVKENCTNPTPLQLHFTSYQGSVLDHMLHQRKRLRRENVHLSAYHLTEVFERGQVVYLSGDSENVLDTVDPSLVYVIGGLVDSRLNIKGASLQAACDAGVRHARLPLPEVIIQHTPRPLPINLIFSILFKFVRTQSWFYAITTTIPPKKIMAVKVSSPHVTHCCAPSDYPTLNTSRD